MRTTCCPRQRCFSQLPTSSIPCSTRSFLEQACSQPSGVHILCGPACALHSWSCRHAAPSAPRMMHSTLLQAEELCRAKGIELPQDFAEAAMDSGLRTIVLEEYIRLQVCS